MPIADDTSEIIFTPRAEQSRGIWLQDTPTARLWRVEEEMRLWLHKSLREELLADERYRQMWRKEYEVGCRITSPYVVRPHRLIDTEDECTLVMDYVEGQTLEGQQLTLSQIRQVAVQLLQGLVAIHESGVVHLDLKPSNVMLSSLNGDVRIIDLGGCYSDSFPFSPAATKGFSAPEIREPGLHLDARADLYSVGQIIQYLIGLSSCPDKCSDRQLLQDVIDRATRQEREHRYPSAHAMLSALQPRTQRIGRGMWIAASMLFVVLLGCWIGHQLPRWRGYDFYQDNLYYQVISEDSLWCRVVGKDDSLKGRAWGDVELTIPATTHWRGRNYRVIEVGEKAFADHQEIAYLSVAPGVREIGVSAFQGCDHLRQVHLPEGLQELHTDAFVDCKALRTLRIPSSLRALPDRCFHRSGLQSIDLPEGLQSIGQDAFVNCVELQHVGLPSTLKSIARGAFFQCEALQELTLPEGLESMGEYALMYCPSLRRVSCLRPDPIRIDEVFDPVERQYADSLQSGLCLLVPASGIDLYRETEPWSALTIEPLPAE